MRQFLRRQSGAARHAPVLLQGETGTGKGLLARALHRGSARAPGPFIEVNCAAIPESLLEAELFGYERGAFTDARQAKPGLFQEAYGGTLFLDEIGLLAPALQGKLLQVLEGSAVRRLGATRSEPTNVWVVAATNEDLAGAIRSGEFREDLYHRLAVVTLTLPPLRARGDDVVLLAEALLRHLCAEYGVPRKSLGDSARSALLAHDWPGNVRELSNVVERAVLLSDSAVIAADALELSPRAVRGRRRDGRPDAPRPEARARRDLLEMLVSTSWNVSRTAAQLGISRNTVRARIRRFGLVRGEAGDDEASQTHEATGSPTDDLASPWAPASVPQRAALRWERRHVALLRVALGLSSEPEAAPIESSRWLEMMIDKVQSFGGQVEGVSPAGIEAVFGVDFIEDPPRRAAHTALSIRRQLVTLPNGGDAPAVRLAIHTCQVLVVHSGDAGRIDEASRRQIGSVMDGLVAAARPGSILVSATTATFLRRRFTLESGGRVPPDLAVFYVSGHEQFGHGGWGKAAAFVGRAQELALLKARLDLALVGQGQLVSIIGDPGIGKSRLIWEFTHSRGTGPVRVLETGSAYASITPYLSLRELLRRYFEISVDEDPGRIRERIGALLATGVERLKPLLPAFLALMDVPDPEWQVLDPDERRYRTREAVKELLLTESRIQPVVVVFEDVQWIDSESQAVLDAIVQALPSASLMLVVTYRPEYRHSWTTLSSHTQLRVGPLPPESASDLLANLLGSGPSLEPVKRRLIDWTDGNPFFLEESVQALVETGVLEGDRGAYRAATPLLEIEVPATVEELLAERIDRLAPGARAMLRSAAAVGAAAPLAVLAAVLDMQPDALREELQQLQAAELLYERSGSREPEVVFKHALTREVAYRSLLPEARRDLHRRIVAAIEATYSDNAAAHIDRLAHHAFRGELWAKAASYLRRAGDRALESAAAGQASKYFEQALEALKHQPETRDVLEQSIDLRFRLRDALWPQVRLPSMLHHLREADAVATSLQDRPRQGWVACFLCHYFWAVADPEKAIAAGERALAIGRRGDNLALLAETNAYRGIVHYALGTFREAATILSEARQSLEQALTLADAEFLTRRFVQNGRAILRSFLARALAEIGDLPEAIACGTEAVSIAALSRSPQAVAAASGGLGAVYLRKGELKAAVQVLEPALQVCRTYAINQWLPPVAGSLGAAYVGLGLIDEGVSLLEECVGHAERLGLGANHSLWMTYLGEAYLRAGRRAEALTSARRALALSQQRKERGFEAWAMRLLGEIAADGGDADLDGAASRYQQALAISEERGMRPLTAFCHFGLGKLGVRRGDRAAAEIHLRAAAAEFRALDIPWPHDSPDSGGVQG